MFLVLKYLSWLMLIFNIAILFQAEVSIIEAIISIGNNVVRYLYTWHTSSKEMKKM